MRIGVVILSVVTFAFLVWLGLSGGGIKRAAIDHDPRPGAYADPRRILARIQSDLERVAAGRQSWPLPQGVAGDPLEAIVDAYGLYLAGNAKGMDARLKEIALAANGRLAAAQGADSDTGARALAYFTRLGDMATSTQPTTRMLAGLRLVDGLLFMEAAGWSLADPQHRSVESFRGPVDPLTDTWLRLPCRTAIGRAATLRAAWAELGDMAGPLLNCPSDNTDLAVLEAQAKAPAMLPVRVPPIPLRATLPQPEPTQPPLPWDHEAAVAWMDEDPAAAEAVLAVATSPADKLDYALFLHVFRPAGADRRATIHALLRAVDTAALAEAEPTVLETIGPPLAYDDSDASLVPSLRLAVATDTAPGYAIPCAVLQARPGLLDATSPLFGSTRDNFLPKSGCASGRGHLRGFPDAEIAAYRAAAEEADGHFIATHGGAMVYGLITGQNEALEMVKLDPHRLAALEPPPQDHPYQVWGLASLANRATEQRITPLYQNAATKLAAWYVRHGVDAAEAARAAKTGLFNVVWGANCGDGVPTPSLRGMLLDKAMLADIRAALTGREAPELLRCAVHAGMDPLLLVAVGHPPALALLLERRQGVDERNAFGKTALMVAAQNDLLDSARLLLDKGAAVNATTWMQDGGGLTHDGRSALMYAAANGSLALVKLLLERGADPHMTDTKGRRAVDYLLGFGPTPPNARLGADERAEAARLLY